MGPAPTFGGDATVTLTNGQQARWEELTVAPPKSSGAVDRDGPPTVLIVDDHPLWRQTVRTLIERAGAARQVFEASDGADALDATRRHDPDVVIMDMALPGVHGLDATREITEAGRGTRVLVLSSSDDEEQVIEAVNAGATGYLLKTSGATEILDGLRRVHAGELVFPASLAKIVHDQLRGRRRSTIGPLAALTEREVEVLSLMAEGRTNDVIGATLHLSPKTVEAHVTAIFSKLGLDPAAGGHRRVLAVIAYLRSVRGRKTFEGPQ
jgi:two-component system, NarL family, response regulator LiaR